MKKTKETKPARTRTKTKKVLTPSLLPFIKKIFSAAEDKLAVDLVKIKLKDGIADYFIIMSCRNERQVKSVANEIEKQIKEKFGEKPVHVDGMPECEWVVMDYGNVLVHIFLEELRDFYALESLWGGGKKLSRSKQASPHEAFDDEDDF